MDVSDIVADALVYPLHNMKAFVIYIILGIIAGIIGGVAILGFAVGVANQNAITYTASGVIGVILLIIIALIIQGYTLDIVKYGILRRDDAPDIDVVRQSVNSIKYLIVNVVYYLIPAIITWLLAVLLGNGILTVIVSFIITVVFALANYMAICKLAQSEDLFAALSVGDAISDISRVGVLKIFCVLVVILIIVAILALIVVAIYNFSDIVGAILLGIVFVYAIFFSNRAIGLLYS